MDAFSRNANAQRQLGESVKQNELHQHAGNSAAAQRMRLLDYLHWNTSISTLEARKNLDVLHPAMRILELRAAGHSIDTVWVHQATDCGKLHRVARYVLISSPAAKMGGAE